MIFLAILRDKSTLYTAQFKQFTTFFFILVLEKKSKRLLGNSFHDYFKNGLPKLFGKNALPLLRLGSAALPRLYIKLLSVLPLN